VEQGTSDRLRVGCAEYRGSRGRLGAWLASCCFVVFSATSASGADDLAPADTSDVTSLQAVTVQGRVDSPEQVPALGKTGTKLEDVPASIQIIPREVLQEQGASMLRDAVYNASGVNAGGQDSKGYYDHFLIRGLNAQIYSDGFTDGDQLGGVSHSLNGVERIEILEGPGSALFGSGPPGGTINIVHYTPSPDLHYGGNLQFGSFGTIAGGGYITGPTGLEGLDYRVDETIAYSSGFRDLGSRDYEARPAFEWRRDGHTVDVALDLRRVRETPDSYGLIYFDGSPIKGVPVDSKYSTPFAFAHEDFVRPTLTDRWEIDDLVTVNDRFSYLYRTLNVLGNGDSSSTMVSAGEVIDRQLRQQHDRDGNFDYQLEPLWKFSTGSVRHTLLTGFEYQHQSIATSRSTADLPNIRDAFDPVPPETSVGGLTFLCDAKHSCDDDRLSANDYGLYATDQIDVTDALKLRAGVRQDWFETSLTPVITVPGRFGTGGQPLLAGVTDAQNDAPVSWSIGALYKLFPWMSPYVGASESHLANFNSESTQQGIGAPESARQYETGIKFSFLDERVVMSTAAFTVSRNNVATTTTIDGIETVVFDGQRTRGGEASLDAKLTDQWQVLANVTAQDAVITDNPQAVTSVGNRPQGAPAHMANLWTSYQLSIAGLSGFQVGAGLNYRDKTYSDITNVNAVPSFVVADAMLGYRTPHWGADLNIHNLTNQRYFIAANEAGAYVGEPFSVFLNLHFNH
jgi:iron complex outermembrane recepter protein